MVGHQAEGIQFQRAVFHFHRVTAAFNLPSLRGDNSGRAPRLQLDTSIRYLPHKQQSSKCHGRHFNSVKVRLLQQPLNNKMDCHQHRLLHSGSSECLQVPCACCVEYPARQSSTAATRYQVFQSEKLKSRAFLEIVKTLNKFVFHSEHFQRLILSSSLTYVTRSLEAILCPWSHASKSDSVIVTHQDVTGPILKPQEVSGHTSNKPTSMKCYVTHRMSLIQS